MTIYISEYDLVLTGLV